MACRAQGAAWKSFCNGGEGGSQDMGCQEGVADTKTMGGFNKLATRRNLTPADLSSTEHLTVLNKKSSQSKSALHINDIIMRMSTSQARLYPPLPPRSTLAGGRSVSSLFASLLSSSSASSQRRLIVPSSSMTSDCKNAFQDSKTHRYILVSLVFKLVFTN